MTLPATLYARFSSQEQAKGSSLTRQFELTRTFAESKGWQVDDSRFISDEGRSAFHGANRAAGGALFEFERQAEAGHFRNGHVLVVEHLDRISRQGFQEVFEFLNRLTASGVTVATVDGGTVYEPYKRIDMVEIMKVLIKAELALEESSKKRDRQLFLWEKKLKQVRSGDRTAITKLVPEWIVVDPASRVMSLHPHRSEIVREIFAWSIDGYGSPAIANMLNKRGEDTWATYSKDDPDGRYKAGDKRASRGWTISYVNRLLHNPATIGEYQPMQRARSDKFAAVKGERIVGYYPAVIDAATFAQAQIAREGRLDGGGKIWAQQVNLFSGLARCSVCGDKMGYVGCKKAGRVVNGTSGSRKPITYIAGVDANYLQCNSARRNYRCTNKKRVRYEYLERAVLDNLLHLALDDTHFQVADQAAELHVQIAERERSVDEKRGRLNRLVDSFSRTGSETVERVMLELEREVAADEVALKKLRDELQSAMGAVSPDEHQRRIAEVRTLLTDPDHAVRLEARRKVHQALKAICTITCTPDQVSTVMFANGLAAFRVNPAGEMIDQFNLSNRLDLHRGLTTGVLASNKAGVANVVRRSNKAA